MENKCGDMDNEFNKECPKNPGRRDFLRSSFLYGVGLLAGLGFPGRSWLSESHERRESVAYPDKDTIPALLLPYAERFSSWPELVEHQKCLLRDFLKSDIAFSITEESLREYDKKWGDGRFSEAPLQERIEDIIELKLKALNIAEIFYRELPNQSIGEFLPGKNPAVTFDTIKTEAVNVEIQTDDGLTYASVGSTTITLPIHELTHSLISCRNKKLLSYSQLYKILHGINLDNLEEDNPVKVKAGIERYLEILLKWCDKNGHTRLMDSDEWAEFEKDFTLPYRIMPHEIMARLMECRLVMHVISEYYPLSKTKNGLSVPKYDMKCDYFTAEHYYFLKRHARKIFMNYSESLFRTATNEILIERKFHPMKYRLFDLFSRDKFIDVINSVF